MSAPDRAVADALEALRRGMPVVVTDDADREDEGDLVLAASTATPEWTGFVVRWTSGVLCAPMPDEVADRLELPPMVARNQDPRGTAYTVSVDAALGIGTGISATDRARTLRLLADPTTSPRDLVRPGHVFPLRARPGGVLERPGHTEAAVDLCRLAGLPPVGVIAEVVDDAGEPMRGQGLARLAAEHGLPSLSIAELAAWRAEHDPVLAGGRPSSTRVSRAADVELPSRHGDLRAVGYLDRRTGAEHVAVVAGLPPARGALVRVHSECLTGDAFGSERCDCGPQLDAALRRIAAEDGVVVYLRGHEGRGIGLLHKLEAYRLQEQGLDTVEANTSQGLPADAREYGAAAAVLADLGLDDVRLLTNNPAKVAGLAAEGVRVRAHEPLVVQPGEHNLPYLLTKRDRMGHLLPTGTSAAGWSA